MAAMTAPRSSRTMRCCAFCMALGALIMGPGQTWTTMTTIRKASGVPGPPSRPAMMAMGQWEAFPRYQTIQRQTSQTTLRASNKELDTEAIGKYFTAIAVQMIAITAFFSALDLAVQSYGIEVPDWAVFGLFFGMSIRSRIFSPLDNSRPDIQKATKGEATVGFNDRQMPSWTPPGIFFPIMWILIVAPLRAASSMMIWQQVGHICDATILVLMLHLCIGDTWNTVNNVERRLGAAVPGVLCVWASALLASYAYYQIEPFAGQLLWPTCLWLTVAAALVTDTWRVNNSSGTEPLFPYRSDGTRTRFWFAE